MRLTIPGSRLAMPAQRSPTGRTALIGALLVLVFGLDRATGAAPVQHLYYVPIIVAGLWFTMPGGLTAALASIVLYHVANPHLLSFAYEEQDLIQIVLFLAVGVVTARLTQDGQRLRQLALTDDLTGLHNLRSFEARLAVMVPASRRSHAPIGLFVLDVDRLKSLNDRHGHLTGAEAVRTVGQIIARQLPPRAVACRYGGDEFAVAIPDCTPAQARQFADDLCGAVQASAPMLAARQFPVGTLTVSVGGTCARVGGAETTRSTPARDLDVGEALFQAADAALYQAKASGRNRAWIAPC